jgi:hypothetical protein
MAYPKTPWTLQGYALLTSQLIDVERVRLFIPPEFEIVSVLPGKTVGGVYVSNYTSGSVLEYSELIVNAGMVRYSGKVGGWVSHIYVDNADSVAGGREIWGLPKELAEFTWEKSNHATSGYDNCLTVRQGGQTLCRLSYNQPSFGLQLPLSGDVFSTLSDSILLFKSKFESRVGVVGSKLEIPELSPFASLGLDRPWLTFYLEGLHLGVDAPEIAGYRETVLNAR